MAASMSLPQSVSTCDIVCNTRNDTLSLVGGHRYAAQCNKARGISTHLAAQQQRAPAHSLRGTSCAVLQPS